MRKLEFMQSWGLPNTTFSKKAGAGFTLIELVVAFSILAVLSTIGIAAFVSFSRTQTLNATASDIKTMLNLAKSRAYSQVKPLSPPCDVNQLDGYEVKICKIDGDPSGAGCINTIDADYELDAKCGGGYVSPPVRTGKLPANYSIEESPRTFFFPVLKGGVMGSGRIEIKNNQTKKDPPFTITVGADGSIK